MHFIGDRSDVIAAGVEAASAMRECSAEQKGLRKELAAKIPAE
jgi:hypothetical protein